MKKLLFTLLLAAGTLTCWAGDKYPTALYAVGDATEFGWGPGNSAENAPVLYKKSDKVYEGFVNFDTTNGMLKFLVTNAYDQGQWGPATDGHSITSTTVTKEYIEYTSEGSGKPDKKFLFNLELGLYLITADLTVGSESFTFKKWTSSDTYEIGSLGQLKAFADGVNKFDASIKAALTADITGMDYAIGWYNSADNNKLYSGEFNGNGHTVTLAINDASNSNKGLFGAATGGANIHDVIVAGSVTGQAKVAGIVGYAGGGGTITLTNVINTATIDSKGNTDANAAGLVGCAVNNTVINATNCANTGKISNSGYTDGTQQCAAFAGWTQDSGGDSPTKTTFTNCWNSGTIYNTQGSDQLYRNTGNVTATNCYDASATSSRGQGTCLSDGAGASGELCFMLNSKNINTTTWRQNLGTDDYPVPFTSHSALSVSPINGWYEVSQPWQLCWLAQSLNTGNYATYKEANIKLTNDIDYSAYTDQSAMIGTDDRLFGGIFDGQCHTVTVAFENKTDKSETALFRQISGGTVKNLKVQGRITTTTKFAGGICASIYGSGTIINCESDVTIKDEKDLGQNPDASARDATHGGIVACVHSVSDGKEVKVENCLFSGTFNASGRTGCAGIVGWTNNNSNVKVNNCLVAGNLGFYNSNANGVFVRSTATVNGNNYFTSDVSSLGNILKSDKTRTTAGIDTGELCFKLNGNTSGAEQWYQTKGTDDIPTPFSTSSKIYRNGTSSYTYDNVSLSDGKASIGDSKELIAFAKLVNDGQTTLSAELTADIDMTGESSSYVPIGTDTYNYAGTFDGKGFRIKKLVIDSSTSKQALFRRCGAATIKNLVIDSSCSFRCTATEGYSCAAFVAGCYSESAATLTFENCGNEANVYGAHCNSAAFLGFNYGNMTVSISNCYNKGNISGGSDNCAMIGWNGGNAYTMSNCYNSGTVENYNGDNNTWGRSEGTRTISNCYTTGACYALTNLTVNYSSAGVASGELCYKLNGSSNGGTNWYQNLSGSTYVDAYPVPFDTHDKVYLYGTSAYVSENSQAEIGNATDLQNFATLVNSGLISLNAKLTDDIDMSVENSHTPIGTTSHPYVGTFDGDFHTVNLNIDRSSENYQGLFGVVTDGVFIQNVIVKGRVKGNDYVGGIVGGTNGGSSNAKKTDIWNCGNEAIVTAAGANAGGILGVNMEGSASIILLNCYNTGAITGSRESGALSGWLGGGWSSVRNCYNSGTLTIGDASGTAFGRNNGCHFINCFYTHSSGTYNDGTTYENTGNGQPSEISDEAVTSGELCWKFVDNDGNPFTQDLSQEGHPTFGSEEVHAGKWFNDDDWDTFYNEEGDDKIVYQLNLDDTKTVYNVPAKVTAKNVKMARNLSAGKWNTFCSPVALPKDGNFSAIKELTGVSVNGDHYTMTFSDASSIVAGKPYMVQVSEDKTEFTATDVEVAAEASTSDTFSGLTFNGVFTSGDAPQSDEDNSYFIISNNAFYEVDSEVSLKAFRGYITVASGSSVKALSFDFEDMGDGINSLTPALSEGEGAIYNVAGQRIQKMQKGINIVNGKKIMK